ncbi:hypothetical protein SBA6_480011 [Candidatus Sulfopaludibacter sp. SbA6]|nr:hypothetical protein SBA6_480011 [Candidatus Sulfopaludibacter sp. SbA6]
MVGAPGVKLSLFDSLRAAASPC